MIQIKNLSKIFCTSKEKIKAIDDISLTFKDKGLVFLCGKSGSGKSTFLNLLAGFEKPSSGQVVFDGKDIVAFSRKQMQEYHKEDMGFVFQNYSLLENLSVKENIALGIDENPHKALPKIKEILKEVSLEGYEERKVSLLSGGEKQRVAIARVLIKNPYVIFCDEPTGNLDMESSRLVLNILKERSKKCLVVIVSHNISQIYAYGDRVLKLEKGKILSDVTFSESNRKENEIYLSNIAEMKKDELSKVNSLLKTNPSVQVKPTRYLFSESEKENKDENPLPKKENHRTSPFASFFSLIKTLNLHKAISYLFPLLISLTFALCCCFYQLASQNSISLSLQAVKNEGYNSVLIAPSYTADNKYHSFSSKTETTLKDAAYPIYKIPLFADLNSYSYLNNLKSNSSEIYGKGYSKRAEGVIVADEGFALHNLNIENLSFLCKAKEEKPYGVYISDYLADSILYYQDDYTDYFDILGLYQSKPFTIDYTSEIYINGIIKTDYKEKTKHFFESLKGPFVTYKEDKTSYLEFLYVRDALNVCYSFNPSFKKDYDAQMEIQKKVYVPDCIFEGKYALEKYTDCFSYDENLKENTAFASKEKLMKLTSIDEEDKLNQFLKEGNDKSGFTLSFMTGVPSIDTEENNTKQYHFSLQLKETDDSNVLFWFSKDVYKQLRSDNSFLFSYEAKNSEKLAKAATKLTDIKIDNSETNFISNATTFFSTFSSTLNFLAWVLFLLWMLLILFYILSLTRSQAYPTSIYSACGIKKDRIYLSIIFQFLFFSLFSSPFMALSSYFISKNINKFLIDSFIHSLHFHTIDILLFNPKYILIGTILLFLIMLFFGFVSFSFLLRKRGISKLKQSE